MCMFVCMYIYICMCVCVCVCVCVCAYIHATHMYIYINMYVYTYMPRMYIRYIYVVAPRQLALHVVFCFYENFFCEICFLRERICLLAPRQLALHVACVCDLGLEFVLKFLDGATQARLREKTEERISVKRDLNSVKRDLIHSKKSPTISSMPLLRDTLATH